MVKALFALLFLIAVVAHPAVAHPVVAHPVVAHHVAHPIEVFHDISTVQASRSAMSQGCVLRRVDDFLACDCFFLKKDGHSFLVPEQALEELVDNTIAACTKHSGPDRAQKAACARIRTCGAYKNVKKCSMEVKGEAMNFKRKETVHWMKAFQRQCFIVKE